MRDAAYLKSLPVLKGLYALNGNENYFVWSALFLVTEDMKSRGVLTHGSPQEIGVYNDLVAVRMDLTSITEERRHGGD